MSNLKKISIDGIEVEVDGAMTIIQAAEGMVRWQHMMEHGNSDYAFGWSHAKEAQAWKTRGCSAVAAE